MIFFIDHDGERLILVERDGTWAAAEVVSTARDYYNSSIAGNGAYFGVADWLVLLLVSGLILGGWLREGRR